MADPLARLTEIVAEMRSERPRYKSHDLGYVDSVSASSVDDWADEIEAEVAAVRGAERRWLPIATAPKDGTVIIGALIRDGRVWRVHDMKHNGLAFYTTNGGALPAMTHWMPMVLNWPDPPSRGDAEK